jgi:hypothetical protein
MRAKRHTNPNPRPPACCDAALPGKFRDKLRVAEEERHNLNESITLRQSAEAQSHSGGFETWLRSRSEVKARVQQQRFRLVRRAPAPRSPTFHTCCSRCTC